MTNVNGKLIAIIFSILLITGTVAPVVALGPQGAGNAGNTAGNAPTDRFGTDPVADDPPARADPQNGTLTPPRERVELAQLLLRSVETDGRGDFSNRKRAALSRLNDSLDYYRDDYRVKSHRKFLRDAHATSRLTRFAETDNATTINVTTAQLLWADRDTAALAIEEAKRAVNRSEGRAGPNRLRRARQSIRQAERTFDRADRNVERGLDDSRALDRQLRSRSRAIKQYGRSWKRAQRALRVLDRYVAPELQVTAGPDQVWNGTGTQNRTLRGTVTGIQPWELSDLRVRTGNGTRTVPLDTSTAPASTTNFTVRVETTERVTNLTVEVIDPVGTDEGSGRQDPQLGRDSVAFDGDGLSSQYERSVTETDPLDFDSDSARTSADEADDGVIDGAEDFDGDQLTTYEESLRGTDPFDTDTDGDTLSDADESIYPGFDPTDPDSNDDGVRDDRADPDGDGLETATELKAGTSPVAVDTDFDTLSDAAELREYGTDPVSPDTDGDGLRDDTELELGTDPTDPDTDADGVGDANESYTTTTENESVGVTAALTGQGDLADGVTVERETRPAYRSSAVSNASVTPVVHIESERDFETAELTFEYDDSRVENESDLGVFTFNRSRQTYVRVNSTVDPASDTVTTTVPHFSTFTVFSESLWAEQFAGELPSRTNSTAPSDPREYPDDERWGTFAGTAARSGTADTTGPTSLQLDARSNVTVRSQSVALDGETAYFTGTDGSGASLFAVNATTGEVQWEVGVPDDRYETTATPTVRDGTVYTGTTTGSVVAVDAETGRERWRTSVPGDSRYPDSDSVRSPAVGSERVYVSFGSQLTALDRATGEVAWTNASAVNPYDELGALALSDGQVYYAGNKQAGAVDSETGETVWTRTLPGYISDGFVGPSVGPEHVYVPAGESLVALSPATGQIEWTQESEEAAESYLERVFVGTVTVAEGTVYTTVGTGGEGFGGPGRVRAFDSQTGRPVWNHSLPGVPTAPAVADGRVYAFGAGYTVLDATDGAVVSTGGKLQPSPSGLGPAVANGQVLVPSQLPNTGESEPQLAIYGPQSDEQVKLEDSDGDGLPDKLERVGVLDGLGRRHQLDPFDADTDGDGIPDGEEVGEKREQFGAYYALHSDPTEVDSDGDGLSDAEEREGHTVATARSRSAAVTVRRANDTATVENALQTYRSDSDPLYADTDQDGLSDLDERLNRTDPRLADTDRDSIPDGAERDLAEDPTVFDARGPNIQTRRGQIDPNGTEAEYVILYRVTDPSGVTETTISVQGDQRFVREYDTPRQAVVVNRSITVDATGRVVGALSGVKVTVTATDRHGNSYTELGYGRPNGPAAILQRYKTAGIDTREAIQRLAQASGMVASFGRTLVSIAETPQRVYDLLTQLLEQPEVFIDRLTKLVALIQQRGLGVIEQLAKSIVDSAVTSFEQRIRINNPYGDTEKPEYTRFRGQFVLGYTAGTLMTAIAGASVTTALKSASGFTRLTSLLKSKTFGKLANSIESLGDRAPLRVVSKFARAGQSSVDLLKTAPTVGGVTQLRRLEGVVGDDAVDRLDATQRQRLGRALLRDEDNAETLEKLDDRSRRDVLGGCGVSPSSGVSVSAADDCPSAGEILDGLEGLDDAALQRAERLLAETGDDGKEFLASLETPTTARKLLQIEERSDVSSEQARDVRVVLARSTTSDAADYDFEKVRQFADDIDELKNTDGVESLLDDIANKRGNFDGDFSSGAFQPVKGSIFEARVAGEIGSNSVERLNLKYTSSDAGDGGDLDVIQTDDNSLVVIDAKSGTANPDKLDEQLTKYQSLRGKTIEGRDITIPADADIRFVIQSRDSFIGNGPDFVQEQIKQFIQKAESTEGVSIVTIEEI